MICRVLLLLLLSYQAFGQRHVITYHDPARQKIREDYYVVGEETIEGKYKRYFENGNVEMEGAFVDGVRSGTFLEYHENGKLLRKISYVNGMRHGPVEVYDEQGVFVQRAFYQNNLLVDSVKSYYDSGTPRMESRFVK